MSTPEIRPTHSQIAARVGVSRSKVTEVLHGTQGSRVSAVTRRRIERVARDLGYQPRARTTHSIGYVFRVESLELEAEATFLRYVQQALREKGYRLTLSDFDAADPTALNTVLNPKTVDGVIFTNWFGGTVQNVLPPELPWVLASDEAGVPPEVDMVALDAAQSARDITTLLLKNGHRRLCLVIGALDIKYHWEIKRGVREAIQAAGLPDSALSIIELSTNKDIAHPVQAAMRSADPPTAVLTTNPSQAGPTLQALVSAGCRIPEDVSLASITDSRQFEAFAPPITATTGIGYELAQAVVVRLLEKIRNPGTAPRQTRMPAELVLRESVAKIGPPVGKGGGAGGRIALAEGADSAQGASGAEGARGDVPTGRTAAEKIALDEKTAGVAAPPRASTKATPSTKAAPSTRATPSRKAAPGAAPSAAAKGSREIKTARGTIKEGKPAPDNK